MKAERTYKQSSFSLLNITVFRPIFNSLFETVLPPAAAKGSPDGAVQPVFLHVGPRA